jgi:signal transduction histidine kinase
MSRKIFQDTGGLRDLFFTMIESLPCGLLLADSQGGVLAVNRKGRDLLDLMDSCLQGCSCYELLEQAQGMPAGHTDDLRRPGGRITWEKKLRHGLETSHLAISRQELKSPFQEISGFFLMIEDITYLAMIESRLNRQQRFAAMQEIALYMSQELKNPLGSLELYASLLKRELEGEESGNARLAVQMLSAIRAMDHLLDNCTTFVSLPPPRFTRVNIGRWLKESIGKLELLAKDKAIAFHLHCRHRDNFLEGDTELLQQLSLNLGLNGVESMASGGELRIESGTRTFTDGHPDCLEVRFVDQGHGIDAQVREKIFDPFFTTKDRAGGLGLAIVHHVAEIHGGLLEVSSQPGEGSAFTVLLPVSQPKTKTDKK